MKNKFKEITKERAFSLLSEGYKAVSIDNSYHASFYCGIAQNVYLFKLDEPSYIECVDHFNDTGIMHPIEANVNSFRPFENENDICCDHVWYYLADQDTSLVFDDKYLADNIVEARGDFDKACKVYRNYVGSAKSTEERLRRANEFRCGGW